MASPSGAPETFTRAVGGLRTAAPRREILLEEIAAPRKLAAYAFALSATVLRGGDEVAGGRLILLHDPAGHEAWQGNLRLVTLVTAELESDMAGDPLLPPRRSPAPSPGSGWPLPAPRSCSRRSPRPSGWRRGRSRSARPCCAAATRSPAAG